jgi:hypothetical protein
MSATDTDGYNRIDWKRLQANRMAQVYNNPTYTPDSAYWGNGSSAYIDIRFNQRSADTLQVGYSFNSVTFGAWGITSSALGSNSLYGALGTSSPNINPRGTLDRYLAKNGTTTDSVIDAGSGVYSGFFATSRNDSTAFDGYRNGELIRTVSIKSVTPQFVALANLRVNAAFATSGVAIQISFMARGLTPATMRRLYNAFNRYMTTLDAL